MLKQTLATCLASLGLFVGVTPPSLAETFIHHTTIDPDVCTINLSGKAYYCSSVVVGALRDGTGNVKLCDPEFCIILILSRNDLLNLANERDFVVNEIAFQDGRSIVDYLPTKMLCGINRSDGFNCVGKMLNNGLAMTIEVR